jgi:predicted phage baseplate assembly protein
VQPGRQWGPVRYSYRAGDRDWSVAPVRADGTGGLSRTGVVVLEIPRHEPTPDSCLRISVEHGLFPASPQIRDVRVNVLPVVQRTAVPPARLDRYGTGLPDQVIEFDTAGLVPPADRPDGPALEIDVDGERWHEQPDFTRSGPGDRHFVRRPGRILFGNGINGRRPPAGALIAHTALAGTAGTAGNLRPGQRWTVPALGADGDGYGRNRHALTGGRDASTAGDITDAARDTATRRSALLTDEELADAARTLPGMAVRRAEVLAGHDPRLPGVRVAGVRTLVVVPHRSNQPEARAHRPGRWLAEIAARLGPRRVLGERLIVQQPVVVPADLWLRLVPQPGAVAATVVAAVERALRERLSPEHRQLGRELTAAEVATIAAGVPGVADVPVSRLAYAGEPAGDEPVPAPRDGLVVAATIEVERDQV